MNAVAVDALLERIFLEADVEDYPEPPQHPRFKWKPPTHTPGSGKVDPKDIPPGLMKAVEAPPEHLEDPEERIGKYSMKDLLPPEEVATKDDLIDFMAKIGKARGKKRKAWEKEFV
jgi:hypothetical protein